MSSRDAVVIVSRAFALYLLFWALSAASYLPEYIFSFSHHAGDASVLTGSGYFRNLYLITLIAAAVRSMILLALSLWFYRSGAAISRFLLPTQETQTEG